MKPFNFNHPDSINSALRHKVSDSQFIAGGTNQLDLMKKHIKTPDTLIDINSVLSKTIVSDKKGILLGAAATNTEVAVHSEIQANFPLVSKAILAGASPQIRNMATTGGNLLQRTRCPYFYDTASPCNKRKPNSGCSALNGHQRMAGIIGTSNSCVAVHPSDFCVALVALDAEANIMKSDGSEKIIPFEAFHRLPENQPDKDNNLPQNAIITSVFIPENKFGQHVSYVKIRERDSYAFALVSVAAALEVKSGKIKEARLASGGVAHKPWRWYKAEDFLKGKMATRENFEEASKIAASSTKPLDYNTFKVDLLKGAVVAALLECISKPSNT
ncbi:FAD binding domain-containing protein [Winogradskyella sp. A3E31]|uniref:FAD binding domain-containing protein n=1 Tax=Winogradskyella sp. A3E31 TaxID=3349637 RepID=UPI00398B33F1